MTRIGVGTFESTPLMRHYADDILKSGRISYGPYSQTFERRFAEKHGCQHAILSNSGTSSLLVALQTLKELHNWQDGDEIIVPALTFVATVNIVLQAGLKPILVDVEKNFYGIDCTLIDRAITKRTRAIIPVHTFGQPCDMIFVMTIAHHFSLKVIEDSCECMLVRYWERPVGSWGNIACFSTYVAHLITTGVGGIAITNNDEYAKIMRSLVNHGMDYDDLSQSGTYNPQRTRRDFNFVRVGHSFRITELEAALGLAQLQDLPEMIARRQENAKYLTEGLSQLPLQLPAIRDNSTQHAFMMYPIVCLEDGVRDDLMLYLEEKGVESRRMLPLVSQPVYKGLWEPDDYSVAKWIDDNGYYVGVHQHLEQKDLDYVIEIHEDFFSNDN